MSTVEVRNLSIAFPERVVIRDLSFTIPSGELAVLIGPSGTGKTTILRAITGQVPLSSGQVLIDDRDVTHTSPADRDIAMVFQNLALYPHMTVRGNWEFPLRAQKLPKEEIERRVIAMAETLEMRRLLHRLPHELSGGQRQRVALGRALVREPKLFLLDEPLGALDAKLRIEARTAFKSIQQDLGVTTIYVTHDQNEAQALGSQIILVNNGVSQQVGSPEEIYEQPANQFVAGFFGTPPMNFLAGHATRCADGILVERGELRVEIPLDRSVDFPSAAVAVGIRPESMHLLPGS
ncbi:MAG TPA: ABC transporter ATP-binding protein, partial [Thermomicrobiales bacterium]|nr:ABC transporter ATP-binding protein [Thermomicrobiales bacterium]